MQLSGVPWRSGTPSKGVIEGAQCPSGEPRPGARTPVPQYKANESYISCVRQGRHERVNSNLARLNYIGMKYIRLKNQVELHKRYTERAVGRYQRSPSFVCAVCRPAAYLRFSFFFVGGVYTPCFVIFFRILHPLFCIRPSLPFKFPYTHFNVQCSNPDSFSSSSFLC